MIRTWRFFSRWQNLLALFLVALFLFVAAAAPLLSPLPEPTIVAAIVQPEHIKLVGNSRELMPQPPDREAPLGTLANRVDVYHALVWGARSALSFGLLVVLISASLGILLGAASAYLGGTFNGLTMRITDAFLAVPVIAGVALFQQMLNLAMQAVGVVIFRDGHFELIGEPIGLQRFLTAMDPVMLALILLSWMPYTRLMNAMVLRGKQNEYIDAARALGAGNARVILRHLIPNTISPAIVLAAREIGGVVLLQATFTFIGLGGKSVWGDLLVRGKDWVIGLGGNVFQTWWAFLPATLALVLFGISWNLLGDGLNDWLNPKQTG